MRRESHILPAWWDEPRSLTCGHCGATFLATPSQLKHHKYEQIKAYCSPICRTAADSQRKRQPTPVYGPCPTCGSRFESRVPKTYCSLKCYVASPAFRHTSQLARERSLLTPRTWGRHDSHLP